MSNVNYTDTDKKHDASLMRCVWLLNATTASFVEAKQLLQQIAVIMPKTKLLLDQESMPANRKDLFSSELKRFQNECTDLMHMLLQARGDKSDNKRC